MSADKTIKQDKEVASIKIPLYLSIITPGVIVMHVDYNNIGIPHED